MEDGWTVGFENLEEEHHRAECAVTGVLPAALRGCLFRNGPARHTVYGDRYNTWFDGDGMVHAIRFSDGGVTATNRFVATRWKAEEDRVQRRLFASYGTPRRRRPGPPPAPG